MPAARRHFGAPGTFVSLVIHHHPRPEHVEDFLAFMRRVESAVEGAPGF